MTIYDDLRKHYGASSAEQKLLVLRRELLRPIVTVQSSAQLLQHAADQICDCLPADISPEAFKNTVNWLAEASRDLQEILDALTKDLADVQEPHGIE